MFSDGWCSFMLLTQAEHFQPFICSLKRAPKDTKENIFLNFLLKKTGCTVGWLKTFAFSAVAWIVHPSHTCGRSSGRQRGPSKRRSGCRRRSLTVRCKWLPSRGECPAELSVRPLSAPWLSIISSCAFSHTQPFWLAWRGWVFYCWAGP